MKKAGIALVSVLLAGSIAAFAGCGENGGDDTGKIDGNFKDETDPVKAAETVQGIDFTKAFGDMSESDWALGIKVTEKLNVGLDLSVADMSDMETAADAATPDMRKIQGNIAFEGSGLANITKTSALAQTEMSVKLKEKDAEKEQTMSAKAYLDGSYVYASAEADGEDAVKAKVSLKDIMGAVGSIGGLPVLSASAEGGMTADGYEQYVQQAIAMIYTMGGKLSFDQKDGLKIKATFGDEFFATALTMASMVDNSEVKAVISGISFTKGSSIEAAVAFDTNGLFTEFGLNVDFGVNLDSTKLGVVGGSVTVSGGVIIETTADKVTLPAGLATDTTYEEVDISDLFPGKDPDISVSDQPFDNLGEKIPLEAGTYIPYKYSYLGETATLTGEDALMTLTVNSNGTFAIAELVEGESKIINGKWIADGDGYAFTTEEGDLQVTNYEQGLVMKFSFIDSAYYLWVNEK